MNMKKCFGLFNLTLLCIASKNVISNLTSSRLVCESDPAVFCNEKINSNCSSSISSYYSNLNNKFSLNSRGSCGFNAINILLSYYDSNWDDSIIDENYDLSAEISSLNSEKFNSPGTTYQDISFTKSSKDYYNKLYETTFLKRLLDIGIRDGMIKLSDDPSSNFGLCSKDIYNILYKYLQQYTNVSNNYEVFYDERQNPNEISANNPNMTNNECLRNEAIQLVKKGYPVLMTVFNPKAGHAIVAYDYDETTDSLYSHFGYKYSKMHSNYLNDYETIGAICTIIPKGNYTHKHSNNYNVLTSNIDVCGCQLESHSHLFEYKPSHNCHIANCYCGYTCDENHFVVDHVCVFCKKYLKDWDEYGALD